MNNVEYATYWIHEKHGCIADETSGLMVVPFVSTKLPSVALEVEEEEAVGMAATVVDTTAVLVVEEGMAVEDMVRLCLLTSMLIISLSGIGGGGYDNQGGRSGGGGKFSRTSCSRISLSHQYPTTDKLLTYAQATVVAKVADTTAVAEETTVAEEEATTSNKVVVAAEEAAGRDSSPFSKPTQPG